MKSPLWFAVLVAAAAGSSCVLDKFGTQLPPGDGATAGAAGAGGTFHSGGSGGTGGTTSSGGAGAGSGGAPGGSTPAGSGGVGATAGQGGSEPTCPQGEGPAMLLMTTSASAFCIDATEVTAEQYQDFLDAGPVAVSMPAPCDWKTTHVPDAHAEACKQQSYQPTTYPDRPVVCVDWCDALAFCEWAGKRLCGGIGGGPTPYWSWADPSQSEWFHACSANGTRAYPYGDTYDGHTCVGDEYDDEPGDGPTSEAEDVMTAGACVGGYTGLYDMSGNVWEWENSCAADTGQWDTCRNRGGSYWDWDRNLLRCDFDSFDHHVRGYRNTNIGFRCCATPVY